MRAIRLLTSSVLLAALARSAPGDTAVLAVVDVKGATAAVDVSSGAISDNDGNILVVIKNNTGLAWNDLTVELVKKGTPSSAVSGGSPPQNPGIGSATLDNQGNESTIANPGESEAGGEAAYFESGTDQDDFGQKFTGGVNISCLLKGCSGGSYGMTQVIVTPSLAVANQESNLYGPFRMSALTDVMRNGNPVTSHGQVVARVVNVDDNLTLEALEGVLTLPEGFSVSSVSIRENMAGYPLVSGATVTVQGPVEFTVTGLDVDPQVEILVVVELNAAVGYGSTQLRLEAAFGDGS